MNVKCRTKKTYHHENQKDFIHPTTDFNFSHHGKITSKNPTDRRTRRARRVRTRVRTPERRHTLRGSMEPQRLAFAPRPFHRHGGVPHVSGADRFLFQVPSRIGQKERGDPDRDGRNPHPCRILRRMAQGMGSVPHGKRSMERECRKRGRRFGRSLYTNHLLPGGATQRRICPVFHGPKLSCPYREGRCSRGQCDLRTGLPQQLAHT